jgi:hypothetical protein
MLDAIFWAAVIVAILCGVSILCIELYEEWADDAHASTGTHDDTSAA